MATDRWGIDDGWSDTDGRWHPAPPETIEAFRAAMANPHQPTSVKPDARHADASLHRSRSVPAGRPVWVVRPGAAEPLLSRCHLRLEDGTDVGELDTLPPDLPLGLHWLTPLDGGPVTTLIVSPRRCHLPADLRAWGAVMQVPTTRSADGWGIGDLADVRRIASWLDGLGAGALGLSPLHAPTPVPPIQPSPYYPSSRRWKSPLLIRVEEVPRGDGSRSAALEAMGPASGTHRLGIAESGPIASHIDRDGVWARKHAALVVIWDERSDRTTDELDRWRAAQGLPLEGWARFCALAEVHGPSWSRWPSALQHPDSAAVTDAVAPLADRVAFHAWLQLLIEQQLDAANVGDVRLIQDLAIGVDPDGADAWLLQDLLALDVSVGAPPDDFAPDGQRWGLPPFVPWRLRDAGYRPLAELLRGSMAAGGGLRVDHVMGLARLFWIPGDGEPADGTYVRFAGGELLEVLALESARAGAVVVGEDLGTVEAGFREELQATGVLSTRLVWFEDSPPHAYPRESLAMVTTHDLPTIAGVWTGADDAELAALGRPTPPDERTTLRRRLDALVDLPPTSPVGEVIDAVHRRLAESPAALTLATLEDLCEVPHRPNVPGTSDAERPNWSVALPLTVEEMVANRSVASHMSALRPAN